jgi:hypothetical protein
MAKTYHADFTGSITSDVIDLGTAPDHLRNTGEPSPVHPLKWRTSMIQPSLLLRRAILADAIFSGVSALLLSFGAGALAPFLNLPEALLRETGLFLVAYAAFVGWLAPGNRCRCRCYGS